MPGIGGVSYGARGGAKPPKYYNTNEFLLLIKQKTEEYRERAYAP